MIQFKTIGGPFICAFLFCFASCKHDDKVYTVCDCKSTQAEDISSEGGLIVSTTDSFKIISVKHGYISACNGLPTEYQVNGLLVLFSDKMISTCTKDQSGYGLRSTYLELGAINKIDTLYVNESPKIPIGKTEDYDLHPGFGYTITDVKKSFEIKQLEIPDLPGTAPFKSYNDALKIAFVMAFRLETTDDFPSVYLGDLYFLQIQGI